MPKNKEQDPLQEEAKLLKKKVIDRINDKLNLFDGVAKLSEALDMSGPYDTNHTQLDIAILVSRLGLLNSTGQILYCFDKIDDNLSIEELIADVYLNMEKPSIRKK